MKNEVLITIIKKTIGRTENHIVSTSAEIIFAEILANASNIKWYYLKSFYCIAKTSIKIN